MTLIGIFNREGKYYLLFGDAGTTSNFVYHVYVKMANILTKPNRSAAFQTIGVEFDIGSIPYGIVFRQEKLRESKGFIEFWNIDYPVESLTLKRRNFRFE
jgi:hypothetical protein